MIAQRVPYASRSYDQHVASLDARKAAAIEASSLKSAAHAEQRCRNDDRQHHDHARDRVAVGKIQRSAENQARGQRALNGHALLV